MSNLSKTPKVLANPRAYLRSICQRYYVRINNLIRSSGSNGAVEPSDLAALDEIKRRSLVPTDFNDHLVTMFVEAVGMNPSLIVELGVRGGESTFVFDRVARLCRSKLVSVDIDDCADVMEGTTTTFVQSDDVAFAQRFKEWCTERDIQPNIDVLLIDTSHLYDHTVEEIRHWFPLLSSHAKVFLHDTNLKDVYTRADGTKGLAWDNDRGVIRALEDYLGKSFDETHNFVDFKSGWLIRHYHYCNGLTILERFE